MEIEKVLYGYLANEEHFSDGASIMEEGSKGSWACIILEGRVKVKKRTAKGLVTVDTLKEGDIFGEMALFGPAGIRTASIVAEGNVKVWVLDTEHLVKDYDRLPPHLRGLLGALVARLKGVTERVISLALLNEQHLNKQD